MPIYKYRTLEEAEKHLQELTPDPWARLSKAMKLSRTLRPRKPVGRGVIKFKTLEEANRHRERWEED